MSHGSTFLFLQFFTSFLLRRTSEKLYIFKTFTIKYFMAHKPRNYVNFIAKTISLFYADGHFLVNAQESKQCRCVTLF